MEDRGVSSFLAFFGPILSPIGQLLPKEGALRYVLSLPAGVVILSEAKNRRSTNQKESNSKFLVSP